MKNATRNLVAVLALVLFVGVMVTPASAAPITVGNHSFETPTIADGGYVLDTSLPSWTHLGESSGGAQNLTATGINEATVDGSNVGWLNAATAGTSRLVQDLTDTYVAGQTYTLTVAVARRKDNTADYDDTEWKITLGYDDGTVVGSLAGTIVDYDRGNTNDNGDMFDVSFSYTADASDAGKVIRIGLWHNDTTRDHTYTAQVVYDNVRLIPEPATLCLLAVGGTGILVRRRRRS